MATTCRFIATKPDRLALPELLEALNEEDSGYALDGQGTLAHGGHPLATLAVTRPGEPRFEQERTALLEELEGEEGKAVERVRKLLQSARFLVLVAVRDEPERADETAEALEPVWTWLFETCTGVLHSDLDGYFDEDGPVLES